MNAVCYLLLRQARNRIRRTFSKPGSAIITCFVVLFYVTGPAMMMLLPRQAALSSGRLSSINLAVSFVPLFVGMLLLDVMLSRQTGLFTPADASILFTSPVQSRNALVYAVLQTMPSALLTTLMMTFYLPFLIGGGMGFPAFLAMLLDILLMFLCVFLSYYAVYFLDIQKPGTLKKVYRGVIGFTAALLAVFAAVVGAHGWDIGAGARAFFESPLYSALPVFGWAKWGIMSAVTHNYLAGYLPATALLLLLPVALGALLVNTKADFYERALEDSVKLQKLRDAKKSGDPDKGLSRKVRAAGGPVRFRTGAQALFSRQWLEMKKSSPFYNARELIFSLIYVVIAAQTKMGFGFALGMVIFMSMANSLNQAWHAEFKKPYAFLIPDSAFRKLFFSVAPSLLRSLLSGVISVTVAAVLLRVSPGDAVGGLLLYAGFDTLFYCAELFSYRVMGEFASVHVLMFVRMMLVMFAAVPSGVVLIVMAVALQNALTLLMAATVVTVINAGCAALLLFFSRKLFETKELME